MDKEKAIDVLSQASLGILTLNDDFKEACRMGMRALASSETGQTAYEHRGEYNCPGDSQYCAACSVFGTPDCVLYEPY